MTAGRYLVMRHGHRWAVGDGSYLRPHQIGAPHNTHADAQAACDRLNARDTPKPRQDSLFTDKDNAA